MSDNPFALSNIQRDSEGAAPANANPFSLDAIQRDQGQDLRNKLRGAVTMNPDQAAEADKLAKRYPVPQDVLARNLMDVKLQAAVEDADKTLQTSPKLAQALREKPWLAQQSHDDFPALTTVAKTIAQRTDRTALGTAGDIGVTAIKGAVGLPQAFVGLADLVSGGYAGKGLEAVGLRFEDAQKILDGLYSPAQQQSNEAVREAEGFIGTLGAMLSNPSTIATTVGQSAPQMLGGAAIGKTIISAAPKLAPWLAAALGEGIMGAGAAAEQTRQETDDGLLSAKQVFASVASGAGTALFGAVGGRAAQRFGLGDIDTALVARGVDQGTAATLRSGFAASIVKAGISEGVFEELPQSVQEQMWSNWAADRPLGQGVGAAAAQGLLAGLAMGGGFQAVTDAAARVEAIMAKREQQTAAAEAVGENLQTAMQAAAASKLRERNPETFNQLVQFLAESNEGEAPASVFIDAQVLAQSGVNVAELLPSAADQMEGALASKGTVEVSISDVLTAAPGTPLEQVFLQNARGTPDGLSVNEAKQAGEQADQWKAEADRVMAEAQDQQAWAASAETVKTTLLDQLNTAGRFTPDVNEAYATLVRDFYSVMAGHQGITPEEMYARYPLRVMAQAQTAGPQLEQGPNIDTVRQQWDAAGLRHSIIESRGRITLSQVIVPAGERSTGKGTAAMQALVAYADQTGQRVELTPSSDFGGNKKRLTEFYKRFGFVENKGRNKDFEISEAMYRPAQQLNQSPAAFDAPETGSTPIGDAATVDVDGKTRPALNSNGQPIHPTLEGVRNFWRWFGDSKVVDADGKPLVVYHGTRAQFQEFDYGRIGQQGRAEGAGFYFTTNREVASGYGEPMEVYLAVQKPMAYDAKGFSTSVLQKIVKQVAEREAEAEGMEIGDGFLSNYGDAYSDGVPAVVKEAAKLIASDETAIDQLSGIVGSGVSPEYVNAATIAVTGFDGVTADGFSNAGGDVENRIYVALTPTQIKSATGNSGAFDGQDANILRQQARGTFSPAQLAITLNENADLSTFLHESGHFFLEVMADLASQPNAPADVQGDMGKLLKWFGVTDNMTWQGMTLDQKRPYHEKFAESFEQYLLEGRAPSSELQPLFRKFRSWMLNVYKSLTQFMRGRDLKLSDDVRQVFDRMLATDDAIRAQEEAAGLLPDFDATNDAIEKLQARSLRDLKWTVNARNKAIKKLQKEAAALRKGVEGEVRAEVEGMPEFRAQAELKKIKKPTDLELATVADSFGYESADAMLKAIDAAGKKADVIEGMTDQRMLERHGDLVDQRAIEEAANEAVHNAARAKSLATELKAQSDAMNVRADTGQTNAAGARITVNTITEAAKQFAQNLAARRRVKDLKSAASQHRAAEARAGKRWQEATAAGKTEEAVAAKRDQLLNNYTTKALLESQAEVRKIREFFARVTKGNNEKTVERGRDPDVVNAARAILAEYDVAPRLAKQAQDYMDVVRRNDPAMHAALEPSVVGAMQNAKPIGEMTMEELRGLHDEIQAMWHLAKRSRQMEVDGNLMDLDDAADELQARMQEVGVPDSLPGETSAITPKEKRARVLQHAGSLLRRAEQWAEGMDGKFGGPFLRLVFQPVKEAANRYRADRVRYRREYQKLVDAVAPSLRKGPIEAPELGYTFGKGHNGIGHAELLHAILHTGNDSNKRKLLLGRGWATENADGTLDTSKWDAFIDRAHAEGLLTGDHYTFAQGVWDLLEQTKPLAQKTHRDVFGRYFEEVTANEVVTPFGTYRGGYVPAQADPRIVNDANLRSLAELENENMAFSFPTTNKGFTKGRTEYNRPLMLDLRTIGQHIDKVLLFAHMEPAVRDVNKLLSQKGVSYSLSRIDPTIYAGMLTPWLSRSARQIVETPIVGDGGISRVLSAARSRAGMALMFANVSNTLQQVTGFATAFSKIKSDGLRSHMMRATAQFIASPKQTAQAVASASTFMDERMKGELSNINDAMDQILLDPNLFERAQAWSQKHAYFLQTAFANTMEPIIWTAGYNGALEKGMSEADAVRYADGLIRQSQGSTLPEDVSRIETGPAYARVFTQFIGYFNMMANTNATALKQLSQDVGLKAGAGKALGIVTAGMLVPLWVAEAIAQAMRGGPEDEDDDGYLDDWLAAVFGMGTIKGSLAMVPFIGQAANAGLARFNSNPADDKISMSPAVSMLEATVGLPSQIYKAVNDPDKINARNAVRDVASAISLTTGLPAYAISRPLSYLAGVEDGKIEPTSAGDAVRGVITGTPSPESKQR